MAHYDKPEACMLSWRQTEAHLDRKKGATTTVHAPSSAHSAMASAMVGRASSMWAVLTSVRRELALSGSAAWYSSLRRIGPNSEQTYQYPSKTPVEVCKLIQHRVGLRSLGAVVHQNDCLKSLMS